MLNRVSKNILRQNVQLCKTICWKKEKDKKHIPCIEELEYEAYQKIRELGFTKIKRTGPFMANVILRLFRRTDFVPTNFDDEHWNAYGYRVYTKRYEDWVTGGANENIYIDYSDFFIVRTFIYQDEYIECPCHFFDIYLHVSK